MPPRRYTRPADNPQLLPRPGFQTVLNSLLAQRDAALGVTVPSQPIAHWQSSSQPEILWELLAERRQAGIPPTLSQEQDAAVEAAISHIPPTIVDNTILEMENTAAASQGASPALTVVSDEFWDALQVILPASGIPPVITRGPSFQEARQPTPSGGSSPMDTSSDGIVAHPPHSPSLITPLPAVGDLPNAPIILSSDSDSPPQTLPVPSVLVQGHEAASSNIHTLSSPSLNVGGVAATPSTGSLMEGEHASDDTPIDSVSSWGRDAGHPLELSSDSPPHSSLRSSEIPDVPDMGSACRGGKMSTSKVTEEFEGASPAVLARARYLNVVPARDTRSVSPGLIEETCKTNATLLKFANTSLSDGEVFTYANMDAAHEEAVSTLQSATDELNSVRVGFVHNFLRDPITLVEDPSVLVESEYLWKMADIVGAVLCGGPCDTTESADDIYASLLPGEWFRLATFMTASIARGCVRSSSLAKKGTFDIEPCKDNFVFDRALTLPGSQTALLQALAAQIMEELQTEGALLPQDSADGLQATIWRAHEGQIRAWTEKEVLSVYSRLSDICLSDIMDKLEEEAPVKTITDLIREEIVEETCGKYLGLIAQERTKAFDAAITEARAVALSDALALGKREAEQKGQSYEKIQLDRAEDEACTEVARIFKNRMKSAQDKMAHQIEVEIRNERDQVLAERHSALEAGLAGMDWDTKVEHIRSLAVQVGLLDDSSKGPVTPPKRATQPPPMMTATKAASEALKQPEEAESVAVIARFIESSAPGLPTDPPHPEPSPCPAAGEDDLTPKAEVSHMDWADDTCSELPSIDFSSQERSLGSSIHCAANTMVDDPEDVVAVSSFRDPDSGPLSLSPSITPSPSPEKPPSEVAQLFNLIMDTIRPIQTELKRISDKVDGKVPPKPHMTTPATTRSGPSATQPHSSPPAPCDPSPPPPHESTMKSRRSPHLPSTTWTSPP
jgi:hypothetical protein